MSDTRRRLHEALQKVDETYQVADQPLKDLNRHRRRVNKDPLYATSIISQKLEDTKIKLKALQNAVDAAISANSEHRKSELDRCSEPTMESGGGRLHLTA